MGHTSFESKNEFVFQFATNQAGTYFYHCHKNTVLHFEMGMYDLLLVDPANPDSKDRMRAPYRTGGPGLAAVNLANFPDFPGFDARNYVVRYDVEALWVVDEFDTLWHELSHDAFMQDCDDDEPMAPDTFDRDGFLNDFRPDVFVISGAVSMPATPRGVLPEIGGVIRDRRVVVKATQGQTILIRLLNAGYTIQQYTLGLDAIAIETDGRPFGVPPLGRYSAPFLIPAGTPFQLTSARRLNLLIHAATAGQFPFEVRYFDWLHGPDSQFPRPYHVARTVIDVT